MSCEATRGWHSGAERETRIWGRRLCSNKRVRSPQFPLEDVMILQVGGRRSHKVENGRAGVQRVWTAGGATFPAGEGHLVRGAELSSASGVLGGSQVKAAFNIACSVQALPTGGEERWEGSPLGGEVLKAARSRWH